MRQWIAVAWVGPLALMLATAGLMTMLDSPPRSVLARGDSASMVSADCTSCHIPDATLSHPVGVRPSMRVPDFLPLDNGRITCTTCHTPDDGISHDLAIGRRSPMLRGELTDAAFCRQCHAEADFSRNHGNKLSYAHANWADKRSALAFGTAKGRVDSYSQECVSCHDGSTGKGKDIGNSHPVGVAYQVSKPRPAGAGLRNTLIPAQNLDPRIHLFDGAVGCLSCHNPYGKHDKLLVMSNTQSNLCTSCHQFQR